MTARLAALYETADIEDTHRVVIQGCGRDRAFDLLVWALDHGEGIISYGTSIDNTARFIFTDADSAFQFKLRFG